MTHQAFLCLGGNLGAPEKTFAQALALLEASGVAVVRASSLYRTPPWGPVPQPDYLNQVVEVRAPDGPEALLALALEVERHLGRDRSREQRFGPRAIDIDILIFGDAVHDTPDLVLPHPRLAERAFALVPLAEIAPDARVGPLTAAQALARLDRTGIERVAASSPVHK